MLFHLEFVAPVHTVNTEFYSNLNYLVCWRCVVVAMDEVLLANFWKHWFHLCFKWSIKLKTVLYTHQHFLLLMFLSACKQICLISQTCDHNSLQTWSRQPAEVQSDQWEEKGTRRSRLSNSETAFLQPSLEFTEKGLEKRKYRVSSSSLVKMPCWCRRSEENGRTALSW